GHAVPVTYWDEVYQHWEHNRAPGGGWGYHVNGEPYTNMTAAGVTSLFVVRDQQYRATNSYQPLSEGLRMGIQWLEKDDRIFQLSDDFPGYSLFGIERAALASGRKYFGEHDWFRVHAQNIISSQAADGSWHTDSRVNRPV